MRGRKQPPHQRLGNLRLQRAQVKLYLTSGQLIPDYLETGAPLPILLPEAQDEEHAGLVWWTSELGNESRRVQIAPLKIVDLEHEQLLIPDPGEGLAQRAERLTPELLRIGRRTLDAIRTPRRCGHSLEDREESGQSGHVPGQDVSQRPRVHTLEDPAEVVCKAVEAGVRNSLSLVTAPSQDQGIRQARCTLEIPLDQRGFPNPRRALDENRQALSSPHARQRRLELCQLAIPAKKGHLL